MAPSKSPSTASDKAVVRTGTAVAKPPSNTPYQLDPAQTLKAARALLKFLSNSKDAAAKPNLLADPENPALDAENIWLILTTKKLISDTKKLKPSTIRLPHALRTPETTTVCLIVKDPQRHWKDVVAAGNLSATITKVVGLSKLAKKHKTFEQRRQLLDSHDVFLADDRVVRSLPKLLGSVFYKKSAKVPIPVEIAKCTNPATLRGRVAKALSSTYLQLSPAASTAVRVALSSFTPEQLAENVAAAVGAITEKHVPGGWRNLRTVHVKGPETASLPIWMTQELYGEEDVLKPGEEERKRAERAEKDAERKARLKAKKEKKRKSLGGTEPGEAVAPAPKKLKVVEEKGEEVPKVIEAPSAAEDAEDVAPAEEEARSSRIKLSKYVGGT